MANWNPNAAATLGEEWLGTGQNWVSLDSAVKFVATSFDQSVSQIIGGIQVPNVNIPSRGGIYAVEVYDNEALVSDINALPLAAVPTSDVNRGTWVTQAGGTTSLFATIDETATGINTADYITNSGALATYTARLGTGALSLTGKRISGVQINVNAAIGATGFMYRGLNIAGAEYMASGAATGPSGGTRTYSTTWTYNPATGKPWTIADVQALATTGGIVIKGQTQAGVWSAVQVYAVWVNVYTITELRIAVGILDDRGSALTAGTPQSPAWNTAAMLTPLGAAWTKDGSGRHTFTVRRISITGSMNVPYLDQPNPLDPNFALGRSWEVLPDPSYGHPAIQIDDYSRLHPFILRTTAPANSVDSLPYVLIRTPSVYSGRTAEQEFSNAASANYGIVRFYLAQDASGATTDDLLIKVKRRSDNVQMGGTYTLTKAAWSALSSSGAAGPWKRVQIQLPVAATLVAGTQYFLEFSSTQISAYPWSVLAVSSNGAGQEATFQGTTDAATVNGARSTDTDLLATLSTIPTGPASMTAVLGSQSVQQSVNCVAALPRADLSWATTALGGTFTRYELQRSEDAGASWQDIAKVMAEATLTWKDYEAKRGIAVLYRVRVVRNDGAVSAWTQAGASVTKPLLAGTGAGSPTLYLVSNYTPTLNQAFEYRPVKDYTFHEADEQTLLGVYGASGQVGANPIENRGASVKWTFLVGIDDMLPAAGSWDAFDALRNLAIAAVPYVCVLDHRGNRMYAQLRVAAGTEDSSGGADRYLADVTGTELVYTPFQVTA